ncbi:hypothetical protein LTR01_005366 [Friedmanniomyces endolithicus]|nr:hypothetical protein LTR01_005366 [Friedmanniomyces endolithicus]
MPFVVFFELFGRVLYVQFSRPPPPPPPPPPLVVPEPLPAWEPPRGWGPARAHELEAYHRQSWPRKSKSRTSYFISTNELDRKARMLESPISLGPTQHRGLDTNASTTCSVRKRQSEQHLLIRAPIYREPELIDLDDANRPLPEVPWLLDENWEPVR